MYLPRGNGHFKEGQIHFAIFFSNQILLEEKASNGKL